MFKGGLLGWGKIVDSDSSFFLLRKQLITDYNTFGVTIQEISFIWHTHYGNTNIECPKLDPLCREIPLEMHGCKCVLTYSICKTNIDLNIDL